MNQLIRKKSNNFHRDRQSESGLPAGDSHSGSGGNGEEESIISTVDEDLLTVATWIQLNYIDKAERTD